MTNLREHLSAWAVVALLAGAMLAAWGLGARDDGSRQEAALACIDAAAPALAVEIPRRSGWAPDAVLAGLPEAGGGLAAYEISEQRNLERYRGAGPVVRMASAGTNAAAGSVQTC